MESSAPPTPVAKKLKPVLRAVSHMIKKGITSRRKLMLDLHLLLERTKIAGKAIASILTFNNNHHNPAAFFYSPREVEFSCSNTPSYPPPHVHKQKNRNSIEEASAASIARAFEMMSEEINYSVAESVVPSPSLRVTDSVFPIKEDEEVDNDDRVDRQAEDFIRRFYEQLRVQQRMQ